MAVCCLLGGSWLAVAFVDYSPLQPGFLSTNTTGSYDHNLVGKLGADIARISFNWLGVTAWLLPVFTLWALWVAVRNARRLAVTRFIAMLVALASGCGLMAMTAFDSLHDSQYFPYGLGGVIGNWIYNGVLTDILGVFGSGSLLFSCYLVALIFIFTKDITAEYEKLVNALHAWRERRAKLAAEKAELRRELKEAQARSKADGKTAQAVAAPLTKNLKIAKAKDEPLEKPVTATAVATKSVEASTPKSGSKEEPKAEPLPASEESAAPKATGTKLGGKRNGAAAPAPAEGATATDTKDLAVQAAGKLELNIVKPEEPKKARAVVPLSSDENYQFPPLTLLKEPAKPHAENSEEEHRRNAENLLRILSEFGVEVTLGEIHVGPVITRYEVAPAPGVRVEKIAGLDKNIALGMRAQSVRMLAPIPGKAAVGVEVPNQHPTPVGMREILESEDWVGAKAELPIALGKDVSGKPLISDLTKMPHLLIAGATGSGKSVCINSIVASILYSKSPKDVRLLMVDPKVVELKVFNTLPHMLIPVVTEPKKVPAALKWLLNEMEQRYQMFAKCNVRNVVGFNNRKKHAKPEFPPVEQQDGIPGVDPAATDDGEPLPDRLPYIVAIIDELADLMMVAPAEIETSIARLAQLARAAGIHLIIATQRPSVNVITGVIKANLPSRIAFQVASQVDSRTILDTKGADTLIGRGDMLFSPPGSSRLVRAQGAFVSDDEVIEMVDFLKRNGPPIYASDVQAQIDRAAREEDEDGEGGGEDGDLGDDEELYRQALDVLKSTKRASTSMIQRRLRIGYNRAARIMDLMEDKGIVGPENGSSPREILVDLDSL
ncbi:MAG TPA: DNA translocase FtsK [Opitutaceae bacterium]